MGLILFFFFDYIVLSEWIGGRGNLGIKTKPPFTDTSDENGERRKPVKEG
jgi:hypothetical protein